MYVRLLVDVAIGQLWSDCWAGGGWWCGGRGRAQQQPTGRWSQAGPATTHQDTGGMEAGARARDTHRLSPFISPLMVTRTPCKPGNEAWSFTNTEKVPTRAFSWLKAPTSAFTFMTLLKHFCYMGVNPL